jgi:hypothetical protein
LKSNGNVKSNRNRNRNGVSATLDDDISSRLGRRHSSALHVDLRVSMNAIGLTS